MSVPPDIQQYALLISFYREKTRCELLGFSAIVDRLTRPTAGHVVKVHATAAPTRGRGARSVGLGDAEQGVPAPAQGAAPQPARPRHQQPAGDDRRARATRRQVRRPPDPAPKRRQKLRLTRLGRRHAVVGRRGCTVEKRSSADGARLLLTPHSRRDGYVNADRFELQIA